MIKNRYIRFDWAAKYMLRNKADFAIFEGLISVLVKEKVTIVELLDTEWGDCSELHELALKHYTWKHIAQQYEKLY